MAKQSIVYLCDYCNTTRQTEKGIKSHEATCKHNPAVIETTKKLNTFDAAIEDIRVTAKTVPELLDRIQTFLRTQDIELTFTSTPYQWSDCVSNSHTSPKGYPQNWCGQRDAEGIPKGYPGWQGSWKGSIKYISKTKEISFSDLRGVWHDSKFCIPFLHTGSGNSGSNFTIEGRLFLYDFPTMHNEWKMAGKEFALIGQAYSANLQALNKDYLSVKKQYVDKQPDVIALGNLIDEAQELLNSIVNSKDTIRSYYDNEYKETNEFHIPELPSAFVNLQEYQQIQNQAILQQINKPDTTALYKRTEALAKELAEYKGKYAEYFV